MNTTLRPITLEEARKYRGEQRAFYGYDVTIPFFGREIVPAGGSYVMVSKKITSRFSLNKLIATFITGTHRNLQIYLYVSEDDDTTKITGFNPLMTYSPSPFLVGDDNTVTVNIDFKEFEKDKFIKIVGINEDTYPHTIDVQVFLKIYPNL